MSPLYEWGRRSLEELIRARTTPRQMPMMPVLVHVHS